MQRTYRIVPATTTATAPRACRAPCSRNMFTSSPFYPLQQQQQAFNPVAELAPLFRVLDSAVSELAGGPNHAERAARRHRQLFTPRFDVREVGSAYELKGEVPGVEQKDLQIEFVDEKTLVVRGSSVHEHESSNRDQTTTAAAAPAAEAVEGSKDNTTTTTTTADDAASEKSASYHKASVEDDEDDFVDAGAEAEAEGEKSDVVKGKAPSTAAAEADPATSVPDTTNTNDSNQQQASQQSKYWVSERSTGSFERRFVFPGRVDQEAVRASLKNGILSVVVPKLAVQEARRIEIL